MSKKIRLLHLIDQLGDAGAETLLYNFATGLDWSRFDLHVCALRPWSPPQIVPALRALGCTVTELDQHHAYDLPVLLTLIRYVRRHKIDLIHTHLLASDVMGRVVGGLTRVPVVSTIHNGRMDLDHEPRHRQWMERWSARLWCRRLIVVSALLRDEIADWFGLPRRRVVVIPNAANTSRFQPQPGFDPQPLKQELLGGDYRLVTNVARLVPQKAQQFLVEAAAQLAPTHPDVRFVIVGGGPLGDEMLALAAALGIAGRIIVTGIRSDVPAILAASDVFVLSSLWEGMPISLLEAMTAGCPAVATNVGGVGQLLQQGVTGLLVPPADSTALASAIRECLDDPAAARRRATAAAQQIAQHYSLTSMVRKWEAIYRHELHRPR
ncbi:MAG: glycosyltransferase [Chloroflexota bacterium]|nr:glycosyltransferase [Chloroflexota bacterium]